MLTAVSQVAVAVSSQAIDRAVRSRHGASLSLHLVPASHIQLELVDHSHQTIAFGHSTRVEPGESLVQTSIPGRRGLFGEPRVPASTPSMALPPRAITSTATANPMRPFLLARTIDAHPLITAIEVPLPHLGGRHVCSKRLHNDFSVANDECIGAEGGDVPGCPDDVRGFPLRILSDHAELVPEGRRQVLG